MSDQTANNNVSLANYGSRDEVRELSERLQSMIPGATKLTQAEALTLGQVALSHNLDPFNGEVWLLKSEKDGNVKYAGVMIGIKGLRKLARRQLKNGHDDTFWTNFTVDEPGKVIDAKSDKATKAVCWRCELRDSKSLRDWTERMAEIQGKLKVGYEIAREIVGPAPIWYGYGVAYLDEFSKMNLHDRARKRAEAAAIRQRFDIEFSYGEADDMEAVEAEYVDAEPVEKTHQEREKELLSELGY